MIKSTKEHKYISAVNYPYQIYAPSAYVATSIAFTTFNGEQMLSGRGSFATSTTTSNGFAGTPLVGSVTEQTNAGYNSFAIAYADSKFLVFWPMQGLDLGDRVGTSIRVTKVVCECQVSIMGGGEFYLPVLTIPTRVHMTNDLSSDLPDWICTYDFHPLRGSGEPSDAFEVLIDNFTASDDFQTAYYGGYVNFREQYGLNCKIKRYYYPVDRPVIRNIAGNVAVGTVVLNGNNTGKIKSTHKIILGRKYKGMGKKFTFSLPNDGSTPPNPVAPEEFGFWTLIVNYMASSVNIHWNSTTRYYDDD